MAVRDHRQRRCQRRRASAPAAITMACLLGHLAATGETLVNSATFMVAGLDTAQESQIGMLASKPAVEAARSPLAARRLPRRQGPGEGVRLAAAQRPGVELLGQQLPAGPEPARLRHPLLERRHHPACRPGCTPDFLDLSTLERARRRHPHGARHTGRSRQGRRSTPTWWPARPTTSCPWQSGVPTDPAARRRVGVRAQLERPHPGHRQPAREPEVVVPHRRRRTAGRGRRSGSTVPRRTAGQLVGALDGMAQPPVRAIDGPHRGSSAAPPTRRSTRHRAATCT